MENKIAIYIFSTGQILSNAMQWQKENRKMRISSPGGTATKRERERQGWGGEGWTKTQTDRQGGREKGCVQGLPHGYRELLCHPSLSLPSWLQWRTLFFISLCHSAKFAITKAPPCTHTLESSFSIHLFVCLHRDCLFDVPTHQLCMSPTLQKKNLV